STSPGVHVIGQSSTARSRDGYYTERQQEWITDRVTQRSRPPSPTDVFLGSMRTGQKVRRPSIDPVLMIRILIIGYVFAIRSERLLCREVKVSLASGWFCGLSIEDSIPDHSAFSRPRHERFREGDILRSLFERVVEVCIAAGLVGGEGFAVDASLIVAD